MSGRFSGVLAFLTLSPAWPSQTGAENWATLALPELVLLFLSKVSPLLRETGSRLGFPRRLFGNVPPEGEAGQAEMLRC